jgi:hypothetical protein
VARPLLLYCVSAKLRADVRIRIRSRVIRIRIGEACIRTVIPITAEQNAPKANSPVLLLEEVPRAGSAHSYLSRESVKLLYPFKDVLYFRRIGEKFPRVALAVVPVHFDFHQKAVFPELRFDVFQVIDHPKGKVDQLLLGRFRAIEVFVVFVARNLKEGQTSVVLSVFHTVVIFMVYKSFRYVSLGG